MANNIKRLAVAGLACVALVVNGPEGSPDPQFAVRPAGTSITLAKIDFILFHRGEVAPFLQKS